MTHDPALYLVAGCTPVCEAHLETYIDDPAWIAETADYDDWLRAHGTRMTCQRCRGGRTDDRGGDDMDAPLPREDRPSWSDGGDVARASGDEIARHFESYLRHPSVAD